MANSPELKIVIKNLPRYAKKNDVKRYFNQNRVYFKSLQIPIRWNPKYHGKMGRAVCLNQNSYEQALALDGDYFDSHKLYI